MAEQQQLTQVKINETVEMQQHTLQIIDRVEQQQERNAQMIDRLGERIDNLSAELSSSMADLIRIIDYAMEQIGETIRNYLKPSNNGNGSNPPTS
ncbi:MAG: hypothetical protein KME64_38795 [Scytonematopsis contorta HA4267-MV1]|nr:hypothetical protein [Scytonematopsis contorta HA4267-MV1]